MPRCCTVNSLCRRLGLNRLVGSGLCGAGKRGVGGGQGSQAVTGRQLPDYSWVILLICKRPVKAKAPSLEQHNSGLARSGLVWSGPCTAAAPPVLWLPRLPASPT